MANPGVNLAITKDGESYNKLQRPDDFLASMSRPLPTASLVAATPPATQGKRKRDEAAIIDMPSANQVLGSKRTRMAKSAAQLNAGRNLVDPGDRSRGFGPARDCGMRTTLPGLDDDDDAQLSDESMSEALAYLRSVRSEASTIPDLLKAPVIERTHDSDDQFASLDASGGQQVLYEDGTWIAVDADLEADLDDETNDEYCDLNVQEECYRQLLRRFHALRNTYNEALSQHSTQSKQSDSEHSIHAQPPRNRNSWLYTFDHEYPTLGQVSQIDEKTLYRGLEYCAYAIDRYDTISNEKSCWIWTLLAMVGDIGTLDHWKMSRIRDLGHKAGQLSRKLHRVGQSKSHREQIVAEHGKEAEVEEVEKAPQDNEEETQEEGEEHLVADVGDPNMEMSASEDQGNINMNVEANELEQARARLLAQLGDRLVQPRLPLSEDGLPSDSDIAVIDLNTRVTIDMVLTVVAECFGQRDLLRFREAWP